MAEVLWGRLTAEVLRSLARRNAVVVVPVAATEQHGPHLPTSTDTLLANEVARRAAEMATPRQPTVITECVWTGLSEHHMAFGGTITLDFATFHAVIRGIVRSLKRHGFRRVLLVNAHGGNVAALRTITDELTFELEIPVVATTYWHHAAAELAPILERQKGILHAGEAETSMVMAITPELVDRSRLAEADHDEGEVAQGDAYRWRSFAERTPSGALGAPSAATPEKGRKLLEIAARRVADLIADEATWQESVPV
jgi:creatinine amidohydrolase